jgi:predicted CXXCH cytochrome family protein
VFALTAPHVPTETDTDVCAMCHRTHTAGSDIEWVDSFGNDHNALILGTYSVGGDTGLCYVCHGVDSLGSSVEVQTALTSESAHVVAPYPSGFGPTPKDCSSCHDSHGSERQPDGEPYPALLSSTSLDSTMAVVQGAEYCATCHLDRAEDTWDGLAVWLQTAHALKMAEPPSGTRIICSNCHDPHGSDAAPLIAPTIYPPAAPATATVDANDRELCFSCHADARATYPDSTVYQTSSHGVSEATVTPVGEWPSAEETRTVGECQNCHNPMGTSDGEGGVIPKLARVEGKYLCYGCHSADSVVSDTAADLARFAFPETESDKLELAVAWNAERLAPVFDRVAIWTQETTGTAPRDMVGPRVFDVPGSAVDAAYGDVTGDGAGDVVVADGSYPRLVLFEREALGGLVSRAFSIEDTATFVAVGDYVLDAGGLNEIAVVSRSEVAAYTSSLSLYRYNSAGPALDRVVGPVALGDDATGLASGDVTGTARPDLVVTSAIADAVAGELRVFTESIVTTGTLTTYGPYATRIGPRGPGIGDVWGTAPSANEIVVANAGEIANTVSVFDSGGTELAAYSAAVPAGAAAYDTLVANVLPNVAGDETVVAVRSSLGTSSFDVFPRLVAGGLGTPVSYNTGQYYNTASLAAGDVDSDGRVELLVGNAGRWAHSSATKMAPTVQVFSANNDGDALDTTPVLLKSEGVEVAGNAPAILAVDLGPLGESRHPASVAEDSHVSTETQPVIGWHTECTDCHNVHETTSTPAASGAPDVNGELKGAWGPAVDYSVDDAIVYSFKQGVDYEYEVCFKCHSGWFEDEDGNTIEDYGIDIASLVDTRNPSLHATVDATSSSSASLDSFVNKVPAWTNTSVLYCTDCHGNSDAAETRGPHSSSTAPILRKPYWGVTTDNAGYLCNTCHKSSVYRSGVDDAGSSASNFFDANLADGLLHKRHVGDSGFSCQTCHQSHGSRIDPHLIREGLDWVHAGDGGACYTPCHSGSTANAYSRNSAEATPTSVTAVVSGAVSGNLASLQTADGDYYIVDEKSGSYPVLRVEIEFDDLTATPNSFKLYGRYDGDAGHQVVVQAWDWAATTPGWVTLGQLPYSTVDATYTYPIADPRYVSSGGLMRIRIDHLDDGSSTHKLHIDRAWVRY